MSAGPAPYSQSLAGGLLAAREAVVAPIRPALRAAGVTEPQWRVLRVLGDMGPLDTFRLAEQALLHPPSVTRILKDLMERGLLTRTGDPKDGRRSIARLTTSGPTVVAQAAAHTRVILDDYAAKFGPDRLVALRRELDELVNVITA